jgi:hypothetical protein
MDFNFLSSILVKFDLVFFVDSIRDVEVLVICFRRKVNRSKKNVYNRCRRSYVYIYVDSMNRGEQREREKKK